MERKKTGVLDLSSDWRRAFVVESVWARCPMEDHPHDSDAAGKTVAAIFEDGIGLDISVVMVDSMHAVDLGVAGHVIGNICWLCVLFVVWAGRNQAASIESLGDGYIAWCKKNKPKLPTVQHQHSEHHLKHQMPSNQKGESEEEHLKNYISAYHNARKMMPKIQLSNPTTDAERWRSF